MQRQPTYNSHVSELPMSPELANGEKSPGYEMKEMGRPLSAQELSAQRDAAELDESGHARGLKQGT